MTITRRGLATVFILCLIVGLGWLAYAPALGGALLLDDVSNLSGLAKVQDLHSALIFIFSGDAGPLGRPVALASFALQADAWSDPAPFVAVNILIHLVNGCLLSWVLYRVSVLADIPEKNRRFVVLAATAIWLFMPLLASSSLMIVQRMTTLSASFVLLSLAGYLHAREALDRAPRSLVGMSACVVLGTVLATLTKESGVLLPVYVLVLETTILPRPATPGRRWLIWKSVFLLLPTAAILSYLVLCVSYDPALILKRDYTGWERLLTEACILWRYVFNAFVPQPGAFGPFHDGYPAARSILEPMTLMAVTGWIAVLGAALLWRRRWPFFAFAALWFLGGHLLESTVVSLELYFEHRNYLPIVGPVFALCVALVSVPTERRKLAYGGVAAYALVNALVLFGYSMLWGEPAAAARYWQKQFPSSVRAATTAAQYRLSAGDRQNALLSLHRLVDLQPSAGYVLIPALSLSCSIAPQSDHREQVAELDRLLRTVDFSYTAGTMLSELYTTIRRGECNGVSGNTVRELANALLTNPRYANNGGYKRLHHQLMARMLRDDGEFEQAIAHLERAIEYGPSTDLNMMMVTTYADSQDFEAAREYIADARSAPPFHPFKRFVWLRELDELETYIDKLEQFRMMPSTSGIPTP